MGSEMCIRDSLTGKLKVLWEWSEWLALAVNVVDCWAAIASKLAPTVGPGTPERNWLAGRPSSRASPLPQGGAGCICERLVGWQAAFVGTPPGASPLPQKSNGRSAYTFALHHSSGRALARLQLLILIHPPPRQAEWRCSSGDWRAAPFGAAELIACRSREADRRAMPPDEYRSEGTPVSYTHLTLPTNREV